jgi:hypothetical protein
MSRVRVVALQPAVALGRRSMPVAHTEREDLMLCWRLTGCREVWSRWQRPVRVMRFRRGLARRVVWLFIAACVGLPGVAARAQMQTDAQQQAERQAEIRATQDRQRLEAMVRRPLTREEVKSSLAARRQALKARRGAREARRAAEGPRDYSIPKPPPDLYIPPPPDAPGGEFDPAGMKLPAEVR